MGSICLDTPRVMGCSRVPEPPARMMAFMGRLESTGPAASVAGNGVWRCGDLTSISGRIARVKCRTRRAGRQPGKDRKEDAMCGLVGFLGGGCGRDARETAAILERMADAIVSRGPDDAGIWSDGAAAIGLAHRRLSILD